MHTIRRSIRLAALAVTTAFAAAGVVHADTFTLRIGAGQPMQPLEPIFTGSKYWVPKVKERVEKETKHKVNFIEAYGGTVAGPADVLEAVEKGLFDVGLWCACFEPTKAVHLAYHFFVPFVTDDPKTQLAITRKTYAEFPEWTKYVERYNQKWLGAGTFSSYGLGTKFAWSKLDDLKGKKISAAGPNLPWLKISGIVPVQTTMNEAYNSMQSGVYEGLVIFPPAWFGFKMHEVAKHYTIVGWGSTTIYQMSVNNATWNKLPAEIKKIFEEESRNWEDRTAEESTKRFEDSITKLKDGGTTVQVLPIEERRKMAEALGNWPDEMAKKLDADGLPASKLFRRYMEIAEQSGVKLPHKYVIK